MKKLKERICMKETTITYSNLTDKFVDRCKMVCKKIAKYWTEESDVWEAMECFNVVLRKNGCSCVFCSGWVKEGEDEAFVETEFPLWFLLIDDEDEWRLQLAGEYGDK